MRLVTEYMCELVNWRVGDLCCSDQITNSPIHQIGETPMTAVLLSGGLDSAVLLAEEAAARPVQPIYVSAGLAWEGAERAAVAAFLEALDRPAVGPLATVAIDMRDIYPSTHWAIEGRPPGYHTPDEDVYLPGRNIVLFSKAPILCAA